MTSLLYVLCSTLYVRGELELKTKDKSHKTKVIVIKIIALRPYIELTFILLSFVFLDFITLFSSKSLPALSQQPGLFHLHSKFRL